MSIIKPIETLYNGCRFRSRLEARWAVFFDAMDIRWEYEPEGFEIKTWEDEEPEFYLPDFRLTDLGTWVEVKGSLDYVSDEYLSMIAWSIDFGGRLPDVKDSFGTSRGLLWLGPIPGENDCDEGCVEHILIQHHKGGWAVPCWFLKGELKADLKSNHYFDASWNIEGPAEVIRSVLSSIYSPDGRRSDCRFATDPKAIQAYRKARCARFEHGEQG